MREEIFTSLMPKQSSVSEETKQLLFALRDSGKGYAQIQGETGLSRNQIHYLLKKREDPSYSKHRSKQKKVAMTKAALKMARSGPRREYILTRSSVDGELVIDRSRSREDALDKAVQAVTAGTENVRVWESVHYSIKAVVDET